MRNHRSVRLFVAAVLGLGSGSFGCSLSVETLVVASDPRREADGIAY
jgi:hypothetical protein